MTKSLERGIDALRRGDAATARDILRALVLLPDPSNRPWLLLAIACQRLGDDEGEEEALDNLLVEDPRSLPGLLLKGKSRERAGDDRSAQTFLTAALRQAAETMPPADLHPLLREAQAFVATAQERFTNHIIAALQIPERRDGEVKRFDRSLDILLGRRALHVSQPSMFYFTGLQQKPFHESHGFDWVDALEAKTAQIRAEMLALTDEFPPYVRGDVSRPRPIANPLLDDPQWGACHLFQDGRPTPFAERCPVTLRALSALPQPVIPGRSPMALFSRLRPGTHIRPHHGLLNTRLICHLPLVVPDSCGIRVGDETREWKEGELLIFDDSFEHEAWNRGSGTRTILLFEIWHPDLDAAERRQLTKLFAAIAEYGDVPVDQG